jgi:hypothetical protein
MESCKARSSNDTTFLQYSSVSELNVLVLVSEKKSECIGA